MRASVASPRLLSAILSAGIGLFVCVQAQAGESHGKSGSVILRMCKSADTVKALSVMCHSYLDGYIDAATHYGKGRAAFCLADDDRKRAPGTIVKWIEAHPESLSQPAVEVLQRALAENFPCRLRK